MLRYRLLILILIPAIVLYTIIRAIKFKDKRYLLQRLGFITTKNFKYVTNNNERPIWIHAASVGEIIAVIPLIQKISNQYTNTPIIVTTNTTTSAEIVDKQLSSIPLLQHCYMPFDWFRVMQKIIYIIQPTCILIVETEIWPNLLSIGHSKNIPTIIINARLSHRTTTAKPWLLNLYKNTLQNVTQILARSVEDYDSYLKLGAIESKLKLVGNIKFAENQNSNLEPILIERPYVLAASTHEDEELQIASVWMELVKNKIVKTEILIIVPRHPNRASAIAQQLKKLDANIAIRSRNEAITELTQIYIADTVGELKRFMVDAQFIFMGGSLISHGGQNIIEPAQLKKAIIFGQHMFNFKDESQLLLDSNAAIQTNNLDELRDAFKQLLQDKEKIAQLSKAAHTVIQAKGSSIVDTYLTEIEKYISN